MADLTDVMAALADMSAAALYPNGTGAASVPGVDCRVVQGWPIPADLDADMAAGKVQVSVYPLPGMDRNTTRFPRVWQQVSQSAPTLTLTTTDTTLTVGGTVSAPQVLMAIVNANAYAYAVQAGDTLSTVAAGLAALIPGASAVGAVVTVPDAYRLIGRVVVNGEAVMETRRQQRVIKITVWAPTPVLRAAAAKAIDGAFADLERFDLLDGTSARLIYRGTLLSDENQPRAIYRRDLDYEVEYATTQTQTETTIGAVQITQADAGLVTTV